MSASSSASRVRAKIQGWSMSRNIMPNMTPGAGGLVPVCPGRRYDIFTTPETLSHYLRFPQAP